MATQTRAKMIREAFDMLQPILDDYGVSEYKTRQTKRGHVIMSFWYQGRPITLTVSGSSDTQARYQNCRLLKGMLEGHR